MKSLLSILFLITLSAACGDEATDRGEEEQALTDGKSDSFFRPTDHGVLTFSASSSAEITEDESFHAWTFKLADEAEVILKTSVSDNLDTVMYLYSRENPEDSWGRYIKKNDNHEDNLWSQITLSGEATEYRVIVKPFKKAMRGSFDISASCEGPGCENPNLSECVNGTFPAPKGEGFTDGCASRIMKMVSSPQVSKSRGQTTIENHCELEGVEQLAVLHYTNFFEENGSGSLEEMFDFGDGISFTFHHSFFEDGHQIDIDAGGDENSATLFYDNDLNLLALYHHSQSPQVQYSCGEAGEETTQTEPPAECMNIVLFDTPKIDATGRKRQSGSETLGDIRELDILGVGDLNDDFFKTYEEQLEEDTKVDYEYAEYFAPSHEIGVLTLSFGEEAPITYTAYANVDGVMHVRSREGVDSISCKE